MVYTYYYVFYGEFENEKKKAKKLTFQSENLNPGFLSIISAHDLNFHGKWGWRDQIQGTF